MTLKRVNHLPAEAVTTHLRLSDSPNVLITGSVADPLLSTLVAGHPEVAIGSVVNLRPASNGTPRGVASGSIDDGQLAQLKQQGYEYLGEDPVLAGRMAALEGQTWAVQTALAG
jgi:hypothetical protein